MSKNNRTNSASEDHNYPDTLRITVASREQAFDDALVAAHDAEARNQADAVVSFETTEEIRRLLTDRRLELLESLMGASATSIKALPTNSIGVTQPFTTMSRYLQNTIS